MSSFSSHLLPYYPTKDGKPDFRPSAPISTGTLPGRGLRVILHDSPQSKGYSGDGLQDEGGTAPSAPPLELMDHVAGYEHLSFDAVNVPPPEVSMDTAPSIPAPRQEVPPVHQISEEEARTALLKFIRSHCCYGSKAAKEMSITKILYSSAFHYELQTFTEKRETSWAFTPYGGGSVDTFDYGVVPLPWEIEVEPVDNFHSDVKLMEVPHTASIKQCHRCRGAGSLLCNECHGKGWTKCLTCHGDGWRADSSGNRDRCFYCHSSTHGHGKQDCLKCNAKGRLPCPTCDSYGQIRCFIRLTITWNVFSNEHIVERTSLPEDNIKEVSGQISFEEEAPQLLPISHFPDNTINLASTQLIHTHASKFHDMRIVAQRHQVRIIPVAEVSYEWRSYLGKFTVYGFENKVYAPDYPQTCCWGCVLL